MHVLTCIHTYMHTYTINTSMCMYVCMYTYKNLWYFAMQEPGALDNTSVVTITIPSTRDPVISLCLEGQVRE